MKQKICVILFCCFMFTNLAYAMGGRPAVSKKIYAKFQTNQGDFTCILYKDSAPKTVANFVELAKGEKEWLDPSTDKKVKKPLYNGIIFHRVIPDFMIQGGDPLGNGTGGPGYDFEDEFDPIMVFSNPGTLAMANSGPNTNGSQFFITVAPTPWLNGKHTIFGRVTEGYDVVEAISKAKTNMNDKPAKDIVLEKVTIIEE